MVGQYQLDLREILTTLLWIFPLGYGHTLWTILRTEKGRALPRQTKITAIVLPLVFASCALIYVIFTDKGPKQHSAPLLSWRYEGIWGRVDEGPRRWWIIGRSVVVEYDVVNGKCSRHPAVVLDSDHLRFEDDGSTALHLQRGDFGTLIIGTAKDGGTYLMEGRDTICFGTNGRYYDSAPYPRKSGV
jgi:hypothetical protein